MQAKWIGLLGALVLALAWGETAHADHLRGGYGYGGFGYPSYGGYAPGFYNRTDHYHYTHPRVTTGYGFGSHYPAYYGQRGFTRGHIHIRSPRGGVDVRFGRGRGGVRAFRGYRGGGRIGW